MFRFRNDLLPKKSPLYFCPGDHCLDPLPLEEMRYGCCACKEPKIYAALPEEVRRALPANLERIWDRSPKCPHPLHHLPLVPRCPVCDTPIHQGDACPPIGIWGVPKAGKTVYCAAFARLAKNEGFLRQTGLNPRFVNPPGRYLAEVVEPLFAEGILPAKNPYGEHRKLVLQIRGDGLPGRMVTLTDMAGEIYDLEALADVRQMRRRRHVLWTRESLFLADPEKDPTLRGRMEPDLFDVTDRLLRTLQRGAGWWFDGRAPVEVRRLVREVEHLLRAYDYPNTAEPALPAAEICRLLPEPADRELAEPVAALLRDAAREMTVGAPLEEQVAAVVKMMEDWNYEKRDGRFDHRIAVTVTKGDLLDGLGLDAAYAAVLADLPEQAPLRRWRAAADAVSRVTRDRFLGLGDLGGFVAHMERLFVEVGYFVVSSIGRETETVPLREQGGSSGGAPGRVHRFSVDPGTTAAAPGTGNGRWVLDKRVTKNAGGLREPAPRHLLLPLMWVLTHGAGGRAGQ